MADAARKLTTRLRLVGEIAEFIVITDDPIYQDRIVHMGWWPADDHSFVRRLSVSQDVERIHENFARHLEEMVLQSARLRPVAWQAALEEFLARVDGTGLSWWLHGSGALAVRGLGVDPGDLDFVVDDARVAGRISATCWWSRAQGWRAGWRSGSVGPSTERSLSGWPTSILLSTPNRTRKDGRPRAGWRP